MDEDLADQITGDVERGPVVEATGEHHWKLEAGSGKPEAGSCYFGA
jgi:hypothetical protein